MEIKLSKSLYFIFSINRYDCELHPNFPAIADQSVSVLNAIAFLITQIETGMPKGDPPKST